MYLILLLYQFPFDSRTRFSSGFTEHSTVFSTILRYVSLSKRCSLLSHTIPYPPPAFVLSSEQADPHVASWIAPFALSRKKKKKKKETRLLPVCLPSHPPCDHCRTGTKQLWYLRSRTSKIDVISFKNKYVVCQLTVSQHTQNEYIKLVFQYVCCLQRRDEHFLCIIATTHCLFPYLFKTHFL